MTTCMGKSCSFGLLCSPVNLYLYQQLIAKELFSAKAYTSYASKRSVKNLEIYVLSKCLISPVNYKKIPVRKIVQMAHHTLDLFPAKASICV